MSAESFDPPSLEALAALLPGYDFESFIAQGGMGAVYKAKQRSLDRDVAIKILPSELGADPEFRQSFETEAKAMARLNHPNLIGVYDFGDAGGMPYIVMEYVNGKSLFHSAHNLAVDPRQAVTIVKGICDGLAHAHENGVIHRDIKPANILLTPKAEPKVGDFGLARPAGAGSTGLLMGTPGYTAPEIIRQPDHADHRSDIFALGVVLYELLIGRCPPYDIPSPPPSTIVGCDPALDAIFTKATHPVAEMRYATAEAMSAALGQWLQGESRVPAPKASDSISPRPVRPPRPVGEAAPVMAKRRGSSNFVAQAGVLAVLIVITAVAWKKLKGMQDEKAAQEASYQASQANPTPAAEPLPKPERPPGRSRPNIPLPVHPVPGTPPDEDVTEDPEVAASGNSPSGTDKGSIPDGDGGMDPKRPTAETAELPPAIVELETKAKSLVEALEKDRSKELAANVKSFSSDLDSWVRTLGKGDQITWRPHVERLKRLAVNDRVPVRVDADSGINLSERMAKVAEFAARKQKSIDETFGSKATKIRDAYVTRVREAASKSAGAGEKAVAEALTAKAEAAADIDTWLVGLGAKGTSGANGAGLAAGEPIVGPWRWLNGGGNLVVFAADGSVETWAGTGKWQRQDDADKATYKINWHDGYAVQLSFDDTGNGMQGTNQDGGKVLAVRDTSVSGARDPEPVVGWWAWFGKNDNVIEIRADGTAYSHRSKTSAKWSASGARDSRTYKIEWLDGEYKGTVDSVQVVDNGKSLKDADGGPLHAVRGKELK